MKRVLLTALFVLALVAPAANAEICTIDNVPAATLLLPYFEVDLGNTSGVTTTFSINNSSATAILAHVVVWSDLSVPVLDFDVYLTGYDVVPVNMRDVLNGVLPRTASAGQDPGDTISNKGPISQDINFASCSGKLPIGDLNATFVAHLQASLTGAPSSILGNLCAGQNLGDNIARGYVTVDTVNACSLLFPGDPGYFASGLATNQNVLWGEWSMVDATNNYAFGDPLVAIEAAPGTGSGVTGSYPATFAPGDYTFYGRYVAGTANDFREPLGTTFAARYLVGGSFSGGTDYIVWRDSKVNQEPFRCGTTPGWYPLPAAQVVMFDEEENPAVPEGCQVSPCTTVEFTPFPAETQRVAVGSTELQTPFNFGWTWLNLNHTLASGDPFPGVAQAWVVDVKNSEGRFETGQQATQLDSACNPNQMLLPVF